MAQLIHRSSFSSVKDVVTAEWKGTALEHLPTALMFFKQRVLESRQQILDGTIKGVPQAIIDRVANVDPSAPFSFTVQLNSDDTYTIWMGEGADRYDLIN